MKNSPAHTAIDLLMVAALTALAVIVIAANEPGHRGAAAICAVGVCWFWWEVRHAELPTDDEDTDV